MEYLQIDYFQAKVIIFKNKGYVEQRFKFESGWESRLIPNIEELPEKISEVSENFVNPKAAELWVLEKEGNANSLGFNNISTEIRPAVFRYYK